jgi:GT2 family glycosyltransferase
MSAPIDVVVPAHCYGRYLRQCVESVLAQDVMALRVLVIDDASSDDTLAVAEALAAEDPRVEVRHHASNRGHVATFNEGVAWCEAPYMLLLSADDYLLPGALRRALDLLCAAPGATLCIGRALISFEDGGEMVPSREFDPTLSRSLTMPGSRFIERIVAADANNIVVCATAVVRTRWLKSGGGYRPDMPHAGDLELWLRLASQGDVCFVADAQAVYRRHSRNMSSAYALEYGIGDLRQRRAAIDAFGVLGDGAARTGSLHRRLLRALAREAIGQSSMSFSDGAGAASRALLAFALETSPGIRYSLARVRLAGKRLLGVRASRAVLRWRRGLAERAGPAASAGGRP